MAVFARMGGAFAVIALMACGATATKPGPPPLPTKPTLAVLPAESANFPATAKLITEHLGRARVRGFTEPTMSKVSLEVVQLSIECVDPTPACYEAVGRSLSATQLLFAQIEPGAQAEAVKVTISLFDVVEKQLKRQASRTFPTEDDVQYGIRDVVNEATEP
ncbi:MAG: hypothetical protein AB7O24_01605 [Kofleriaceae bacterium]